MRAGAKTRSAYAARLKACEPGVSAYGRRYEEMKLRLWDALIRRGLDENTAYREFEEWLLQGTHISRDLEADWEGTTSRMLRQAKGCINSMALWREKESSKLPTRKRAGSRSRSSSPRSTFKQPYVPSSTSLPSLLTHILLVAEHQGWGTEWRRVVVRGLTEADHTALVKVTRTQQGWFQAKLGVLLGALRSVRSHHPDAKQVAISRTCGKRIAGGRQPAWLKPVPYNVSSDKRRVKPAAYKVLLAEAESQGWLLRAGPAVRGRHGTVYRFWLPGDPGPRLRPDDDLGLPR